MQRHVLPVLILALAVSMPARASHHAKKHSAKAEAKAEVTTASATPKTRFSTKGRRLVAQAPAAAKPVTTKSTSEKTSAKKTVAAAPVKPAAPKAVQVGRLARLTAYWTNEDHWTAHHMSSTGVHLQEGHCAVDPKLIPYGSVVRIPGMARPFIAVDTGSAVVSREASHGSGHNAVQRDALVVDLFFENEKEAQHFAAHAPSFAVVSWTKPLTAADAPENPKALPLSANIAQVDKPKPIYVLASAPSINDTRMSLTFRAPQL